MRTLFLLLLIVLISTTVNAQGIGASAELQFYPAGVIPGIRFDLSYADSRNINLRVGYNVTNRQDWGENDSEEGGGFGFSAGHEWRGVFHPNLGFNIRADLWFLEIDWDNWDSICGNTPRDQCVINGLVQPTGTTNITMLQPTLEASYKFSLPGSLCSIYPTFAIGREFNIRTDGRDVGQGLIALVGIRFRL